MSASLFRRQLRSRHTALATGKPGRQTSRGCPGQLAGTNRASYCAPPARNSSPGAGALGFLNFARGVPR